MNWSSWRGRILGRAVALIALWALIAMFAMVEFGLWPRTLVGWTITLAAGPFVYLLLELVAEVTLTAIQRLPLVRRSLDYVNRRTARKPFSWLRVGLGVACSLPLVVLLLVIWFDSLGESQARSNPSVFTAFLQRHFR